jgi:hypothetical protein
LNLDFNFVTCFEILLLLCAMSILVGNFEHSISIGKIVYADARDRVPSMTLSKMSTFMKKICNFPYSSQ